MIGFLFIGKVTTNSPDRVREITFSVFVAVDMYIGCAVGVREKEKCLLR